MSNTFQKVRSNRPGRSVFNLSYEKKLTCDMGELIPTMCDEVVPGDKLIIGNEVVVRFQPLVAPVLHEINCFIHYFFVPYRLLWEDWEDFISGGVDGGDASTLPYWDPTDTAEGSLWDYMGMPVGVDPGVDCRPVDFPKRAYNLVYNEFYRDETQITEVDITTSEAVKIRAWEKDYFTSALPWQQRGTAPALPISGTSAAVWVKVNSFDQQAGDNAVQVDSAVDSRIMVNHAQGLTNLFNVFNENTVDLSSATTFDVADLRLAFQIQKWMERNARAGARYTEFLGAHFGVSPRDDRLQRPEYIGGSKNPVIVSEVLQTSMTPDSTVEDGTPQGNLAGHGLTAARNYVAKYFAQEFGLIIGIMSIMPRPAYQQGIDRQWIKTTKYDFYFPEFANLSEQAIYRMELYANTVKNDNLTVFGYQGRFDEMRVKKNQVCGAMRNTLDYWHLGRQFGSAPSLNQTFIECVPDKRIFAVQDEDGLIVNVANVIKAIRPLPIQSNPGLIDHD